MNRAPVQLERKTTEAMVRLARWTTRIGVPLLVWTVDKPWLQKRFLHDRRIWMVTTNHPAAAVAIRDGRADEASLGGP